MVTSLSLYIGYDSAAALAKEAFKKGKTIREIAEEKKMFPREKLNKILDPFDMTEPKRKR